MSTTERHAADIAARAPGDMFLPAKRRNLNFLEVEIRRAMRPFCEAADAIARANPGVNGENWFRDAGRPAKDAYDKAIAAAREAGHGALARVAATLS